MMINVVERVFARDLLRVSPDANKLLDFTWKIRKIRGFVTLQFLSQNFEDAEEILAFLSRVGIVTWSGIGIVKGEIKKDSVNVSFSEDFEKLLSKVKNKKSFGDLLFERYGEKLIPYCTTDLTQSLATMLTAMVYYATPEKPVFVNKIMRQTIKAMFKSFVECKEILDHYLCNFLGLVEFKNPSLINLTSKGKDKLKAVPELWLAYQKEHTEDMPMEKLPPRIQIVDTDRESLKKLKTYFPWLKTDKY